MCLAGQAGEVGRPYRDREGGLVKVMVVAASPRWCEALICLEGALGHRAEDEAVGIAAPDKALEAARTELPATDLHVCECVCVWDDHRSAGGNNDVAAGHGDQGTGTDGDQGTGNLSLIM